MLKDIETERFALADAKPLFEVDLNYLVADKPVPCKIFLFDAQKFTLAFKRGEKVSLQDLAEIRENFYALGFVHESLSKIVDGKVPKPSRKETNIQHKGVAGAVTAYVYSDIQY